LGADNGAIMPTSNQGEIEIPPLSGLQAIRLRPGMYTGAVPDLEALYHILYETMDSAIVEAMAGQCSRIEIMIHPDSSITVSDNGVGLPIDEVPHFDSSMVEALIGTVPIPGLHLPYRYHVYGGLHGVGLKAVNALSKLFVVEVRRDGYLWRISYSQAVKTSELTKVRPMFDHESTGTSITFRPDPEIFPVFPNEIDYRYETIVDRCRELAFLLPNCTFRIVDERVTGLPRETTFCFESGIRTYVQWLNRGKTPIHDVIYGTATVNLAPARYEGGYENVIEVEFALQYTDDAHTTERLFANTVETTDGSTHQLGLRDALRRTLNKHLRQKGILAKKEPTFSLRETFQGLTAVVSIKHIHPQFESMTKIKLMNPEVKSVVAFIVSATLDEYFKFRPDRGKLFLEKRYQLIRGTA
jgi:DNA gyrase subunit B